jgi:hypothetical protein
MKISEENNSCVNVENNENDNDHSLFNKQSQEDSSANEISNLINQNNLDTIHMMKEIINLDDDNDDKNDSMRHKIKMMLRSNKFNMFLICLVKKINQFDDFNFKRLYLFYFSIFTQRLSSNHLWLLAK